MWRAGCVSQDTYLLEHILAFVTFGSCFLLTVTVAFPPLTGNCGTSDRQCKLGPSIGNSLSRDNRDWQIAANLCNCLLSEYFHDFIFRLNSVEVELWRNEATFNFGCQPKLDQTQILTFPLIIGACNQTFRNFAWLYVTLS